MKLLRILPLLALLIAPVWAQTPVLPFTPAVAPNPEILAAADADAAWKPIAQIKNLDYLLGLLGDAKGAEVHDRAEEGQVGVGITRAATAGKFEAVLGA